MSINKLKKFANHIFGDNENFSLENRLFLSSLLLGTLICIVSSVINIIISPSLVAVFVCTLLIFLLSLLYYLAKFRGIIEPFKIPIIVIAFLGIAIIWVFDGGIDGPDMMIGIVTLLLALTIVSAKIKKFVILLFVALVITIYFIQFFNPNLIVKIPNQTGRWFDSFFTAIYCSIFTFFIIRFIHRHYTLEKKRAEENERKYRILFEKATVAETIIKQQNGELLKLNADKNRFISILSHDLKSPFNTILGYTDLLKNDFQKFTPVEIKDRLGIVHDMSKKTFDLLEDLLLWTKSQSGKLNFEPKIVRFTKICHETTESLKLSASAKNISINYFSDGDLQLLADENMLKTILRNLISNAIKFTNSGGHINVYAEKIIDKEQWTMDNVQFNSALSIAHYPSAIITVSDNGIGIDENDIPKLWDIVAKHSTQGTANEQGTGLGLILCKEFVEKHGSQIWCESEVDKGSEFKFTMPIFI